MQIVEREGSYKMKNDPLNNTASETGASPSHNFITSLLKRTQNTPKGQQAIASHWKKIQVEQPSLARLISVNSFRQAPDDAEVRELISSSMVLMNMMQQEIELQEYFTNNLSESLEQYFPLTR
jgi:hypothetical protein